MSKAGPLSKKDKEFIGDHYKSLNAESIAVQLGRNPDTVKKYIGSAFSPHGEILVDSFNLKKRPYYKFLKKQFTEEELELFEHHWKNLVNQFKEEIFHTEEIQVINAIKHEILGNRALQKQQQVNEELDKIREELLYLYESDDNSKIIELENKAASLTAMMDDYAKQYKDLNKELNNQVKALKGLREQRVSAIEDAKKSFGIWIKQVISDPNTRKEVGQYIGLMKLAQENEIKRLSQSHKYGDGEWDIPILNHETIGE